MQIVIPMAGTGERFKKAGYTEPKPLIRVSGKPMIEYVVNLFPGEDDFLFIVNEKDAAKIDLLATLHRLKPSGKIVQLAKFEQGPVANVLQASGAILDDEPVVVNYCDFTMDWDYEDFKRRMEASGAASASVCYKGFHPHLLGPVLYAGVRTEDGVHALEVREKFSFTPNKMDTWQQAGTFYFKSGKLMKEYLAKTAAADVTHNGEYYVSHMFNNLIRDGYDSLMYPVAHFCQWGTPEDLAEWNIWADAVRDGSLDIALLKLDPERYVRLEDRECAFAYWKEYFSRVA